MLVLLVSCFKFKKLYRYFIILAAINKAAEPWGLACMRYEIRNMTMPARVQEAMQVSLDYRLLFL